MISNLNGKRILMKRLWEISLSSKSSSLNLV